MDEYLLNSIKSIQGMLQGFISSKRIDTDNMASIDASLQAINSYKQSFAKSKKDNFEIVKVFGGLNVIENFLKVAKLRLYDAKKRGENPTTAERLLEYNQELIPLIQDIEDYHKNGKAATLTEIDSESLKCRFILREKAFYPSIEEIEKSSGKKGNALRKQLHAKVLNE